MMKEMERSINVFNEALTCSVLNNLEVLISVSLS